LIASACSQRRTVEAGTESTTPPAGGLGGQVRTVPLGQRHVVVDGQLAGQRLHLRDLDGGEGGWAARPGQILQSGQPILVEPSTPLPDGVEV
jgi:hypothetical protein